MTADLHEIRADHVLLAVGTEPARPAEVPFTPGRVIDSNELLTLSTLPRSIVIVGGGVIGTRVRLHARSGGRARHIDRLAPEAAGICG